MFGMTSAGAFMMAADVRFPDSFPPQTWPAVTVYL